MSAKELAAAAKARGNACLTAKDFDGAIEAYTEVRGAFPRASWHCRHSCEARKMAVAGARAITAASTFNFGPRIA